MTTWAIGDVQGCARTLRRLLDALHLGAGDRVWLVGDLVNRGPRSLDALRCVRGLGDAATVVLGNHDLHLLARAEGVKGAGRRDTLDDVLAAEDRDELLAWLRARPLLVREGRRVLVHGGLIPSWTVEDAVRHAAAASAALLGGRAREFLAAVARKEGGTRGDSAAAAARALTNVRVVRADGKPDYDFSGPPADAPEGTVPWFRAPGRRSAGAEVVFGHWSALGLHDGDGVLGLDTGCVWGGSLTAVSLDDRRVVKVPNED